MTKRPTEVTRSHARVLACVPPSDRSAMANAAHVQRRAEVGHSLTAQSVSIHFQQLVDMGLVELTAGYCRRTPEGDAVIAVPVVKANANANAGQHVVVAG